MRKYSAKTKMFSVEHSPGGYVTVDAATVAE